MSFFVNTRYSELFFSSFFFFTSRIAGTLATQPWFTIHDVQTDRWTAGVSRASWHRHAWKCDTERSSGTSECSQVRWLSFYLFYASRQNDLVMWSRWEGMHHMATGDKYWLQSQTLYWDSFSEPKAGFSLSYPLCVFLANLLQGK